MIEGYKDPTPRMLEVLRALSKADGKPLTGNQIGVACGFRIGHREKGPRCSHNGRVMGPAQRVIFAIIALRKRGLIGHTTRTDGLSGGAFCLTASGVDFCRRYKL